MPTRLLGMLMLLALTASLTVPAQADFTVLSAEPYIQNRTLHVNTRLNLALNPRTEEALSKGIPLEVVIDIGITRHRWWWWNRTITDWKLRRHIYFHALSRQYLVSGPHPGVATESFATLDRALTHMGDLSELELTYTAKKQFEPDARHLVQLRAYLDIETLPTLMRPLAYATPSWRLNTGWTKWPVQP